MPSKKLSARKVERVNRPGRYGDGDGLWLQVSRWQTKSWVYQYTSPTETKLKHGREVGRVRQRGLGPFPKVSLAEARDEAAELYKLVRSGVDPIEAKREHRLAKKLEEARAITFRACAEQYIAAHSAAWKNAKHHEQWKSTLQTYADPILGELSVAAIDTALVLKVLEPIWTAKPETASRTRQRIELVLNWATARRYRTGENPARWKGHLDTLLPKTSKLKRVKHHPMLPYAELPAFMLELRASEFVSARALEFLILTATRTGEVVRTTWDEIDLAAKTWTIPAARTKSGREHKVPLSDRALAILHGLRREDSNPFVFIGGKSGQPLSDRAMLDLMQGIRPGFVPHGFRASFRTWCAESTSYPHHVCETALAHTIPDAVVRSYQRGDLFEKRRKLMADWAKHCASKPIRSEGNNVTPIRSSKKAAS